MRNSPTPSTGPSPAVDADDPSATFASSFTAVPSAVRPGPVQRASASWASRDATTSRSASSASGSRITSPVVPSTSTGVPVCTACRPATPTTQGMPSWRAMIAVWLVGPPCSVASPTTSAGVEAGGVRRGQVLGEQHRGPVRDGHARLGLAHDARGDPALDVAQVGDPLGHQAAHLGEDARRTARRRPTAPTSSGSPALSRLRTAARSPLSRASPAVAVSTSAAAPLARGGPGGEAVGGRGDRRVVRREGGLGVRARSSRRRRPPWRRPRRWRRRRARTRTPGTTGVPRRTAVAGEASEVCDMRPTVKRLAS